MENTFKIEKKALATRDWQTEGPDDKPKMIEPEAGDPVEFHAKGIITSVDGDNATVEVRMVDSYRTIKSESAEETKSKEKEEIMDAARKADGMEDNEDE